MARIQFNAATVPPDQGFDPVPAGWYNVMIDESAEKPTNDGQGSYIEFRYNILDGNCKGRKVFGRHNTRNPSAQAMDIAYKQLSALCHAVNVLVMEDTQQLHGIPLKIKVSLREARTDKESGKHYEASNEVRGWKNINEPVDEPGAAPRPQQPQQPQPMAPAGWGQPQQPQQPMQPAQAFQQPQQPQQTQQPWQGQPAQPQGAPWGGQPAAQAQPWQQPQSGQPQQPQQPYQPAQQPQGAPWGGQPQQGAPAGQPAAQAAPWQGQQPQQPAQPAQPQQPAQQPQQPQAAPPAGGAQPPWAQPGAGAQSTPPWQQPR